MRAVLAVAALFLLTLAPFSSVAGPTVAKPEFKPVDIGDSSNEIVQLAKQDILGQPTPPANVKGSPAKGRNSLAFFEVNVHGSTVPMAVEYNRFASKLFVDLDGSGDLSHGQPLQSWLTPTKNHAFPAFQVKVGEEKVALKVEVVGPNRIYVYPATMLTGKVKFGEKSYTVLLVDAELDGKYNHYYGEKPIGRPAPAKFSRVSVAGGVPPYDVFAIDLKGSGKIEPEVGGVMEAMPLPKMLRVNGSYYKITVSADGQSIDTSKIESPKTGTLSVDCDCIDMVLCSEDGGYRLCGGKTKLELPAGAFTIPSYRLAKKDGRGDLWTINGAPPAGGQMSISASETKALKLGTPVTVKAVVSSAEHGTVKIGIDMVGANGESLETGALKNGIRQNPPSIKIVASDSGKVLNQGFFEYG